MKRSQAAEGKQGGEPLEEKNAKDCDDTATLVG